ncbi:MAG TPA: response regulator [Aggregatilineales bacterium]|nr:response regulator [Aggregatilineales bacterium]
MSDKPLILLVDDDPSTHDIFQDILDHVGMELRVATDRASTLEVLAGCRPDAIVMDIFLPDTDGYKLLNDVRALPRLSDCPVIATTAYYTSDSIANLQAGGFDRYLFKPYDPDQVIKVLYEAVGKP